MRVTSNPASADPPCLFRTIISALVSATSLFFLAAGLAAILALPRTSSAAGKRFRRALVISGGGISPGLSLGIIAGAESGGWKPDVVITTCGSAMGAAIWNTYPSMPTSRRFLESETLRETVGKTRIDTRSVLALKRIFDSAATERGLHQYFHGNVLSLPESLRGYLPQARFNSSPGAPRMIVVAAMAHFGPAEVGQPIPTRDRFSEAFFTDPDTARSLTGMDSPIRRDFPESDLATRAVVISDRDMEEAVRASISDPFLLNPARIGGEYYFTGAVDLFPLELAHRIADEVVATYPVGLFSDYEDEAIRTTFGFSQRTRALQAIQDQDVQWIDMSGSTRLRFDPTPDFLVMKNGIPSDRAAFERGVDAQYRFGLERVQEALAYKWVGRTGISYLRKPISPALLNDFDCRNAWVWRTPSNSYCEDDSWPGCERGPGTGCVPIR